MSENDKTILVSGTTGQRGGAEVQHLLASNWRVSAVTRDSNKPASQTLAEARAKVVRG